MNKIIIKTQAELDALPSTFDKPTVIQVTGGTVYDPIIVRVAWESSHVVARGSSHVEAWGSSHVEAWESSHVVALESSHVVARGSSHVEARGSSHVEAWGSSHVVAWGSSHVVAWGSSHVEAWESSHVVAWESSHVVAWGSVSVHVKSEGSTIELFGFAVAILLAACKVSLKSKVATVVRPKTEAGNSGWIDREGVRATRKTVVLFKKVSKDFKTQEGTKNETLWAIGATLNHPAWNPKESECGEGKFHACSRPYFCDEFRNATGDRYIAVKIKVTDLFAWDNGNYPHKCGFKSGTVLHEVNRFGEKL